MYFPLKLEKIRLEGTDLPDGFKNYLSIEKPETENVTRHTGQCHVIDMQDEGYKMAA